VHAPKLEKLVAVWIGHELLERVTSWVAYDRLVTVFSRPFAIVFLLHPYDNQNPQSSWLVSDFAGRIY
jgi:hypothetical protein